MKAPKGYKKKGYNLGGKVNLSLLNGPDLEAYNSLPDDQAKLDFYNKVTGQNITLDAVMPDAATTAAAGQSVSQLANSIPTAPGSNGSIAKKALSDAASMAGTGMSIGSLFGPQGAVIGTGLGATIGLGTGIIAGLNEKDAITEAKKKQDEQAKREYDFANVQVLNDGGKVSAAKAKEILKDGTIRGKKISEAQKKYFSMIAGEGKAGGGLKAPDRDSGQGTRYSEEVKIDEINEYVPASGDQSFRSPQQGGGGQIAGPGTSKSDSIPARVEDGSFVVPAENADKALVLRAKYLGGTSKKANLNKGGVKDTTWLSDGEHLFTPAEVTILKTKGVDLNSLAPNAKPGDKMVDGGEKGGNEVSEAEKLLQEIEAATKSKSEKPKGKQDEEAEKKYQEEQKKIEAKGAKLKELTEKIKKGYKSKDWTQQHQSALDIQELKSLTKEYRDLTTKTLSAEVAELAREGGKQKPAFDPNQPPPKAVAKKGTGTGTKLAPTGKSLAESLEFKASDVAAAAEADRNKPYTIPFQSEAESAAAKDIAERGKALTAAEERQALAGKTPPAPEKKGFKVTPEDILSAGQMGFGVYNLMRDGSRPVDVIDPSVNASVEAAQKAAGYGFDPYARSAFEKRIEGARIENVGLAAQLGGGDPSRALAQARAATNQYSSSLVDFAAADIAQKMQKQRYADQLVSGRAAMKRDLFQDRMKAFEQNQAAGAALLSSGIENYFGSRARERQLEQMDEANKAGQINWSAINPSADQYAVSTLKNPNPNKI